MKLDDYRRKWLKKPALRIIYNDYFDTLLKHCRPGRTLEIGGGCGNLSREDRDIISTDIQYASWLDLVMDAQSMPFQNESFDNIIMLDVLHHIQCSKLFFVEASRILRGGGRIVMIEPAMTPVGRFFYSLFHNEPVDMHQDPFLDFIPDQGRNPYSANQALPWLIFGSYVSDFQKMFRLKVIQKSLLSLFAYPLSGGFKSWSLIPGRIVPIILRLERVLVPLIGGFAAFRMLIVLERTE